MLLCVYTKGSKDIFHTNCFYFYVVSLLCFHSSFLTDVLETLFDLVPLSSDAPSFLPGIACPLSLSLNPVMQCSRDGQLPPLCRDVPGKQLISQGPHIPGSLVVSWSQVTKFSPIEHEKDVLYFWNWLIIPSVFSLFA